MQIILPDELSQCILEIYQKLKLIYPDVTTDKIVIHIIGEWLDQYRHCLEFEPLHKNDAILKNNLSEAYKLAGKTQLEISKETGIDKSYLSFVQSGKSEPSVKLVLLLAHALRCPPGKIDSLFYLERVRKK